jgi:hypothetical protein
MSRNRWLVLAAAALSALALAGLGSAGPSQTGGNLAARLNTAQELPKPVATRGRGTFSGSLRAGRLTWRLSFSGLTGPAAAAHIHLGLADAANPAPAVSLCSPCRSGMTGTVNVRSAVAGRIVRGGAYVNVHTPRNPAGEIRGQIASSHFATQG